MQNASRTLNEGLSKKYQWETLTSAAAMYTHSVFKVLIFSFEEQWEGQQRHKEKEAEDKAEPN